jgi:hypothetical protein
MPEPLLFISAWAPWGHLPSQSAYQEQQVLSWSMLKISYFIVVLNWHFDIVEVNQVLGLDFFLAWKSRSLISLYCLCSHICPDAGGFHCAMSFSGFLFPPDGCNCAIEAPYLIHFLDLRYFLLATSSHFSYSGSCIVLI